MPWVLEATKDVISCDKPGGVANTHYIPGFPNGETRYREAVSPCKGSKRSELKHLSRSRRRKQIVIAQVVASERVIAQTGVITVTPGL